MIRALTTERLTLRAPTLADWPACRDYDANAPTGWPIDATSARMRFAADRGHRALRSYGRFMLDDGTGARAARNADCEVGLHRGPA